MASHANAEGPKHDCQACLPGLQKQMWGAARRVRFSNKWGKTFTKPSMAMMHYGLCFGCGATTHNRRDNECAPSATTK